MKHRGVSPHRMDAPDRHNRQTDQRTCPVVRLFGIWKMEFDTHRLFLWETLQHSSIILSPIGTVMLCKFLDFYVLTLVMLNSNINFENWKSTWLLLAEILSVYSFQYYIKLVVELQMSGHSLWITDMSWHMIAYTCTHSLLSLRLEQIYCIFCRFCG